jgi:hypothetical protein
VAAAGRWARPWIGVDERTLVSATRHSVPVLAVLAVWGAVGSYLAVRSAGRHRSAAS